MSSLAGLRVAKDALRSYMTRASYVEPQDGERRIWLDTVRREGVCVLPGYFSADVCGEMADVFRQLLERYPAAVHNMSNGADRRMFGIENASDILRCFADDPGLREIAEGILGEGATNAFTLGNRISYREGNLGSGEGWHRDSFFNQFKSLVYLTDVTERSGPFEYVAGSHRLGRKFGDHFRADVPLGTSRVPDGVAQALIAAQPENHRVFTATRGTVVVFDSTGIHRGRPLQEGDRTALTTYFFRARDISDRLIDHFTPVLGRHVLVG